MSNHPRNPFTIEEIAAFVDGELGAERAAEIQSALATDAELRDAIDGQRSVARSNAELWASTGPQMPNDADWNAVRRAIRDACPNPPCVTGGVASPVGRFKRRLWIGGAVAVSLCAAVLFALPTTLNVFSGTLNSLAADGDESDVMAIATPEEIEIIVLPRCVARNLLVRHPMMDEPLTMAQAGDVVFHGVGTMANGEFPEITTAADNGPGPIIWATPAPPEE